MDEYCPDDPVLAEIVRRIVGVAAPERIILFGSRARARHRPDSDYDVLVIKAGNFDPLAVAQEIYLALARVGAAVDVVLGEPGDLEPGRHPGWSIYDPAGREGRIVYEHAA